MILLLFYSCFYYFNVYVKNHLEIHSYLILTNNKIQLKNNQSLNKKDFRFWIEK